MYFSRQLISYWFVFKLILKTAMITIRENLLRKLKLNENLSQLL